MKINIDILLEENGLYRASCPALPGCTTQGRTRAEAQETLQEALVGYLYSLDVAVPAELEREPLVV